MSNLVALYTVYARDSIEQFERSQSANLVNTFLVDDGGHLELTAFCADCVAAIDANPPKWLETLPQSLVCYQVFNRLFVVPLILLQRGYIRQSANIPLARLSQVLPEYSARVTHYVELFQKVTQPLNDAQPHGAQSVVAHILKSNNIPSLFQPAQPMAAAASYAPPPPPQHYEYNQELNQLYLQLNYLIAQAQVTLSQFPHQPGTAAYYPPAPGGSYARAQPTSDGSRPIAPPMRIMRAMYPEGVFQRPTYSYAVGAVYRLMLNGTTGIFRCIKTFSTQNAFTLSSPDAFECFALIGSECGSDMRPFVDGEPPYVTVEMDIVYEYDPETKEKGERITSLQQPIVV